MLRTMAFFVAVAGTGGTAAPDSHEEMQAGALDQARELHQRATDMFKTSEFDRAIDLWLQAYSMVPPTEDNATIRNAIVFNLCKAQIEQYYIDRDVTRLRKAQRLLRNYLADFRAVHGEGESAEREKERVDEILSEIERELERAEGKQNTPEPTPAVVEPLPTQDEEPAKPIDKTPRPGTGLIVGGAVTTAAGLGLLGAMIGGSVRGKNLRNDADDPMTPAEDIPQLDADGKTANQLAIATGIIGGILLGGGVAMLVVGAKKRSQSVAWSPVLSPGFVGISSGGRF